MSDSSKKKRELSPAQENKEALKKSKESDDLDTPTKLMIEQFLAFESKAQLAKEEEKKDQRVKLTRLYIIEDNQPLKPQKQSAIDEE